MQVPEQAEAPVLSLPDARAHGFLEGLSADPVGPVPAARVAVVVAHPDDETIALGGQLPRLDGVTIIHVTDGAPRGGADAHAHGFDIPDAYAKARRRELEAAMEIAGVRHNALIGLGIPDQEASRHLCRIARRLADLFGEREIDVVFTHAYEGGHPDHDATALAVHAASRALARERPGPAVIEMPFYHLGSSGWTTQRFLPAPGIPEVEIRLDPEQRRRKQRMIDAHRTQVSVLSMFSTEVERFRAAPNHDFTRLPNEGRLLYEQYGWGMTGERWQALARAAKAELGPEADA